jgi:hypothetical protein
MEIDAECEIDGVPHRVHVDVDTANDVAYYTFYMAKDHY